MASSVQDEAPAIQPRWYWNIPIVLLVGILGSLGVRGVIKDDAQYSWGTFCKQITYQIEYQWVFETADGERYIETHWHDDELRGDADTHLRGNSAYRNTRYSLGAVKDWVNAYVKYMYENRDKFFTPSSNGEPARRDKIVGFTAVVWYRVNVSRTFREAHFAELMEKGETNSPKQLFFSYPPSKEEPWAPTGSDGDSISDNVKDDDE